MIVKFVTAASLVNCLITIAVSISIFTPQPVSGEFVDKMPWSFLTYGVRMIRFLKARGNQRRLTIQLLAALGINLVLLAPAAQAEQVVLVDFVTSYDQEVQVFVNGKQIAASNLPNRPSGTWMDILEAPDSIVNRSNTVVRHGKNNIGVRYTTVRKDPSHERSQPTPFEITVRLQPDPANARTARQILQIKGPAVVGAVGTTGTKTASFVLQ